MVMFSALTTIGSIEMNIVKMYFIQMPKLKVVRQSDFSYYNQWGIAVNVAALSVNEQTTQINTFSCAMLLIALAIHT